MYWSFKNFRAPDYVLIRARGSFSEKDFESMLDELFGLDYWRPLMPLLLDESDLDTSPLSAEQLSEAARLFLDQNSRLAYTRIAVVLGSPSAMQLAERFQNAVGSQSKAVVEAFLDRKQAEAWLLV
jgi:hypothetical protein